MVKNLSAMQETRVLPLGQEDPLEKGRATHSSILAWRIPWTEEPGGLQSMESKRVAHDRVTNNTGAQRNKRSRHEGKPSPHLEKSRRSGKGPARPEMKYMHRVTPCAVSAPGFLPLAESVWGLSLSLWVSGRFLVIAGWLCTVRTYHHSPFFTHQIMDVKDVSSLG